MLFLSSGEVLSFAGDQGPPSITEKQWNVISRAVAGDLPQSHLLHQPVDDARSRSLLRIYLKALDPERIYFVQSDIDSFAKSEALLDDQLKAGDVAFAGSVSDIWKQRISNRCDYVAVLVTSGFDLEADETMERERKNAAWAANEAEWNEIWRKRIKDDYLRRVIAARLQDKSTSTNKVEKAEDPGKAIVDAYREFGEIIIRTEPERVLETYLTALAMTFDPHCSYMSPKSEDEFNAEMRLSFAGIGAVLVSDAGFTKIDRLLPGGPAERDKRDISLKPGDKIIGVGEQGGVSEDVRHWPLYRVVRKIRGQKGTTVVLSIIPASDPDGSTERKVDLVRDDIPLDQQAAKSEVLAYTNEAGVVRSIGIVRLPAFYSDLQARKEGKTQFRSSTRDVAAILGDMKSNRVEGVVLDLRNNGGGSLTEAVEMTGLFIRTGPVVQVRESRGMSLLGDLDPSVAWTGPVVVLVNKHTASASEILAAALQDYGRAVIVGDSKTHGKGSVQAILPVGKDSSCGSLKVTTALFYRITGGSTQLNGVAPDIVLPSPLDSIKTGEEYLDNPLAWTMLRGVPYRLSSDLAGAVEELERKSRERLARTPDFSVYTNLIGRLAAIQESDVVPLKLEKRQALAEGIKKLNDELLKTGTSNATDSAEVSGKDIVLKETVAILSDLSDAQIKYVESATDLASGASAEDASVSPVRPPVSPEIARKVAELVDTIRKGRARQRNAAVKGLKEMGAPAMSALESYRDDSDPEVRMTVRNLLDSRDSAPAR